VREPQAFLLDEPLSNLDARLRLEMRVELKRLHRELGATIVYVTHDQEEALTLGDRVVVLRAGRIEQVGAPLEVYERPATAFVADFLGSPGANWLDAEVVTGDGARALRAGPIALAAPRALEGGSRVRVAIRPHDVALVDAGAGDFDASIELVQPLGGTRLVHLVVADDSASLRLVAVDASAVSRVAGTRIGVRIPASALHLFDPASERRL
jgi:ABC-type sugar transport system ATPase subunit